MLEPLPLGTVAGAVKFLKSYTLPLNYPQAAAYLRSLWHRANLLSLYHHYFPQEFAASRACAGIEIQQPFSRKLECLYSPKEQEFLRLVDEKLFPFYIDHLLEEAEEREDFISIPNFGVDYWSYGFEELAAGWQLLLLMAGSVERDFGISVADCDNAQVQAALSNLKGHSINWDKFKAACLAKDEPTSYLPLAFDILDHDTGNIFLDPTDEMPAEVLEWSVEDMDYLIEDYRQATEMNAKADKLLDWLTASPLHLQEVINLWNECLPTQPLSPTGHP